MIDPEKKKFYSICGQKRFPLWKILNEKKEEVCSDTTIEGGE